MFGSSSKGRYVKRLLAKAPPAEDQEAYRQYINDVRQMKISYATNILSPYHDYFYAFLDNDPEPYLQFTLSGKYRSFSKDIETGDGAVCAEWLENTYLNTLAVNIFYRYWRQTLVPEYTRRALSNDSDRLIALQAIASDIHSRIHDRYLAGLWERDLVRQLCWQSADGHGLPADNQSPSWSWSSIRGSIIPYLAEDFENSTHCKDMNIVNADCSLGSKSPCGRILDGSIILYASAMEMQFIKNKETELFEFHAYSPGREDPDPSLSPPLKLEFRPDTPLGCQADGSLARSTEQEFLNTRHHNHIMSAILLLAKGTANGDFCVFVCGRESAKSDTCRRLGIGTISHVDLEPLSPYIFKGKFALV